MTVLSGLDAAGRRRSPATLPSYHADRPPRNKGMRYPADPPTIDEIVAVMRHTAEDRHGWRLRAMIVVLRRAGLRIREALALAEHDLDARRGSLLVRRGKGGRRREVGMDQWGWEQLRSWSDARAKLPIGPLFCIIDGPTRGRPWSGAGVRGEFRRLAAQAGSGVGSHRTSCAARTRSSSSSPRGSRRAEPHGEDCAQRYMASRGAWPRCAEQSFLRAIARFGVAVDVTVARAAHRAVLAGRRRRGAGRGVDRDAGGRRRRGRRGAPVSCVLRPASGWWRVGARLDDVRRAVVRY